MRHLNRSAHLLDRRASRFLLSAVQSEGKDYVVHVSSADCFSQDGLGVAERGPRKAVNLQVCDVKRWESGQVGVPDDHIFVSDTQIPVLKLPRCVDVSGGSACGGRG